jgi:hypothetical protein
MCKTVVNKMVRQRNKICMAIKSEKNLLSLVPSNWHVTLLSENKNFDL